MILFLVNSANTMKRTVHNWLIGVKLFLLIAIWLTVNIHSYCFILCIQYLLILYFPGNCYDANQYPGYSLYCPYAYRLPNGTILAKDLAAEYNYLGNSSIWFYDARTKAQEIIDKNSPIYRGHNPFLLAILFVSTFYYKEKDIFFRLSCSNSF